MKSATRKKLLDKRAAYLEKLEREKIRKALDDAQKAQERQ